MGKKNNIKLKTKRLVLTPMTEEELLGRIEETKEEDLKAALTSMLEASRKDPENRLWYVPWSITLKKEKKQVGEAGFHGPVSDDAVEIGFGIRKEEEGKGYATEAAKELIDWAFQDEKVFFVEAESEEDNEASLHVLSKLGFVQDCRGEEGPRFSLIRPSSNFLSIGISLGMCLGMSFGMLLFDNMVIGMGVGMALGAGLGTYADSEEKKRLEEAKKRRKARIV